MTKDVLHSWLFGFAIYISLGCGNASMPGLGNENVVRTPVETDVKTIPQFYQSEKSGNGYGLQCDLIDVETTFGKFVFGMHDFEYSVETVPCEDFKVGTALTQREHSQMNGAMDRGPQFLLDSGVETAFTLPTSVATDECLTPCKNDSWKNGTFFPKRSLDSVIAVGESCVQRDSFFYRSWGLLCYMGEPSLYGKIKNNSLTTYRLFWSPLGAPITRSIAVRFEVKNEEMFFLIKRWGRNGFLEASYGKISYLSKSKFEELLDDSKFWEADSVLMSNSVKDGSFYLFEARVGDRYHLVSRKNNADVELLKLFYFVHSFVDKVLEDPDPSIEKPVNKK